MNMVIPALVGMGGIALALAVLIYFVSRIFHVEEDTLVKDIEALLPGVNCGACGFPGCPGMAKAVVKGKEAGSLEGLFCPPGGQETMDRIASLVGLSAEKGVRQVAVLHCGGDCQASPAKSRYEGTRSCVVAHGLFTGEGACMYGCLGFGECVAACAFDAMQMDEASGLPVIDPDKCTACQACVKACPRGLIQMHPEGEAGRRVWVNCMNTERGAVARKNCATACIACSKCVKVCDAIAQAIVVANNVAVIDPAKCTACGACVAPCPTGAIKASAGVAVKPGPVASQES